MRFWLTLIVSTVLISFGMTWLMMHQGQEVLPVAAATATAKEEAPLVVWDLAKGQRSEANVVEVDFGPSEVDKVYETSVRFTNKGKGPLRLSFLAASCGCMSLKLDDKPLVQGAPPVVKQPNESGTITLAWKAEQKHFLERPPDDISRFAADVKSNDPRFNAALKIEIVTALQQAKGKP